MEKLRVHVPEDLRELAIAYFESRKQDLSALKDALTRKDFDFISRLSHKTKGTAGSYGFPELGEIAKSLEMAAISKSPQNVETFLSAMHDYLANVEIAPSPIDD